MVKTIEYTTWNGRDNFTAYRQGNMWVATQQTPSLGPDTPVKSIEYKTADGTRWYAYWTDDEKQPFYHVPHEDGSPLGAHTDSKIIYKGPGGTWQATWNPTDEFSVSRIGG